MEHETKQKILTVSRKLFYEDGYSNTTIRQIADAAGVSTAVLFHHFINKRDILVHIIKELRDNRKRVIDLLGDDLSPIDKRVLRIKLLLYPMLNDERLLRLHVDEINEKIIEDNRNTSTNSLDLYIDRADYQDNAYLYDELVKYRYHYYIGAANEIMLKFYNGSIPFNKKNIDHHIISSFNLFFNIPISDIVNSFKRVERIMNLISFDNLDYRVLNDEISDYIEANENFTVYDLSKVTLINDVVFSHASDTAKSVEWLRKKFDKVIILAKYYKLVNPADVKGILYSINDFKSHVLGSCSILKDTFEGDFFATGFIDTSKAEEQDGIINPFEKYGVDALKTLRNLNIHNDINDNEIIQCSFIFY